MEKGSPGVSNKIGPLAYDELSQVLQEVQGCPAKNCDFCNFCDFSRNCEQIGEIAVIAKIHYDKC